MRNFMKDNKMSSHASVQSLDVQNRYDEIIKSQEDKRQYRGLKLENGIKVLLVSDQTTDKSAACLCVEVGRK